MHAEAAFLATKTQGPQVRPMNLRSLVPLSLGVFSIWLRPKAGFYIGVLEVRSRHLTHVPIHIDQRLSAAIRVQKIFLGLCVSVDSFQLRLLPKNH